LNRDFIAKHWYASIYEQFENQVNDVDFLLNILRRETEGPQRILEVACGGGRICVPLAKAGHCVTGFDADVHMLLRCQARMKGLPNLTVYQADALTEAWGSDFDVVVIAGNFLINIESDMDYREAQIRLIQNAARTLRAGGHLYLDYDLHHDPAAVFHRLGMSSYFKGSDDLGTMGSTVSYGSTYDPVTQICAGTGHTELITVNGEKLILPEVWHKHIPTQEQVDAWLKEAGFSLEKTYRNFTDEPLPRPIPEGTHRATVWAKKG